MPGLRKSRFLRRIPNFPFAPQRFPLFYGWVILAASVVGIVMSIPGQTMGVGVFTDFLITTTGLDRLTLSTAYMVGTIASSFILPFSGKLLDSLGARFLIVIAASGMGVSLLMLGHVDDLLHYTGVLTGISNEPLVAFCVMTVIFLLMRQFGQGLMTMSSRTMLSKWFDRRRGLAVGISGVFVSFGFASYPLFLNRMIEQSDWQTVCFQLAVVIGLGMTVFGWFFFRDNPEECGLVMDGFKPMPSPVDSQTDTQEAEPEIDISVSQARKSYTFWIFNIALSLYSLIVTAMTFHIASLGAEAGLDRSQVFALFLPMSVLAITTNLLAGWLSDRIQLKYLLTVMLSALFIGTLAMLNLDTLSGRIIFSVGFGITGGLFSCLASVTWPRYYGRKHLGAISGLSMACMVFTSAIGPPLFGLSLSWMDTYNPAIWFCATLPFITLLCALAVKNHR
jgi:OFA family oxalate/formate antiporter-like MFS transporter